MTKTNSSGDLKALYGDEYVNAFAQNQSLHRIAKLLKFVTLHPKDHVADFGCGNGMLMPLIAPAVASYTGVDFSEAFIAAANQRNESGAWNNVEFHCASIQDFCKNQPQTYDKAFALDFSEHVLDDDWKDILIHIRQSLKPGGKLYLHTPNADFFIERMKQHNIILKQFPEHVAVRNAEQNIVLLKASGFCVANICMLPHYLRILKPLHIFSFLPGIGKYFKARIFIEAENI
jgi:2-polyprenyl-6-hydroxyphenyl methylase/3-demethylubiquinone-9 3-methyltransferase